jgi:Ca-activated chloride channel family protein
LLRESEYKGNATFDKVISIANTSLGEDEEGYRKEFVSLVKKASELKNNVAKSGDD